MNRVQKTIYGLIRDLENHLYLLDQSIEKCEEHPANFIQMAGELRVLVTKGKDHEDILLLIPRLIGVKSEVTLNGPRREGERISFNKYLHEKSVTLHGESFSNLGFIKLMCNHSGDFLHVQKTTDKRVLLGNSIELFGITANNRQLLAIARTTSSVAHSLLAHIESMSQDALEEANTKYLKQ